MPCSARSHPLHRRWLRGVLTAVTTRPDVRQSFPFTLPLLIALLVAMSPLSTGAQSASVTTTTTTIGNITIVVEGPGATNAESIASSFTNAIASADAESTTIFAVASHRPLTITFVSTGNTTLTAMMRPINDLAWISIDGTQAIILRDRFLQITPASAENVLRNIVSRTSMQEAADGKLAPGLMDGIARYIERPILADQARAGSLVQAAYQQGTLPTLAETVMLGATTVNVETATATRYALTAFIIDRYGIGSLQTLVKSFATTPDWQTAFSQVLGEPVTNLETSWRTYLPRWFASGWQTNVVAAFDIAPAQTLFDRGAYAAAAARAGTSQQLFSELNDQENLLRVETLLALCAVGIQAETLMTDVQQALSEHDYDRAEALLTQADQQYALLPESHRPTDTLAAYHQLTTDGLGADAQLEQAKQTSGDWLQLRSSRADALHAGSTFARLGDSARASEADALLNKVDIRVRRIALAMATLAILLTFWFGIWVRSRAPLRFDWGR